MTSVYTIAKGCTGLALLTINTIIVSLPCGAGSPQAARGKAQPYDPHAIQLLQEMTDAYTHLSALRQETEFTSAVMPLGPLPMAPVAAQNDGSGEQEGSTGRQTRGVLSTERKLDRKLRLSFSAPNRFRLETDDTDESGKLQTSRWISDGKTFWTFNPAKNLFSREKAPRRMSEFGRLAHMTSGSLEIMMLMGINPFAHVEEQTETVRCLGTELVLGVETEVVAMTADLGTENTETRLYIGEDDHLLHRLVSETAQKAMPPKRSGVGSPLDELAPTTGSTPSASPDAPGIPGVLMKSRVTCDNKIDTEPRFEVDAFSYQPPADAYYLTNPDPQKPPMTMKERIAELNRAARRQKKPRPKVYRF